MGRPRRDINERFDEKWTLDPRAGCHVWTANRHRFGHGKFKLADGRQVGAHVWAYERKYGPVPPGKDLDHVVCNNPPCCNPDHVRPATRRENTLRSNIAPAAVNARKTHCKHGHEFTPENTYRHPRGNRKCRECSRKEDRERLARARLMRATATDARSERLASEAI